MSKKSFDSEIILKQIGNRLRQMRKAKGFKSYEQFAFTHELNRVQYGYYEQGKKDMRLSSLLKVLEAHELTLEEFFSEGLEPTHHSKPSTSTGKPNKKAE